MHVTDEMERNAIAAFVAAMQDDAAGVGGKKPELRNTHVNYVVRRTLDLLTPQQVAAELDRSTSVVYALLRARRDLTVVDGKRHLVPAASLPVLKAIVEERAGNVSAQAPIETAWPVLRELFEYQDAMGVSNKELERRIARGKNLRGMVRKWRGGIQTPSLPLLAEMADALGLRLRLDRK